MTGASEEKTLPASPKKLQDARRKAQVSRAPDLAIAAGTIAAAGTAWTMSGAVGQAFVAQMDLEAAALQEPFGVGLRRVLAGLAGTAALAAGPVLLAAAAASVLAAVAGSGGLVFSTDPLKPKFDRISPAKNLKRVFGAQGMTDLGKSVVKGVAFAAILTLLWTASVAPLMQLPACGMECVGPLVAALARPLLGAAFGVYCVAALGDLLIQRWLFRREMRMTVTEAKRERKDMDGNPVIRGVQRRLRRETAQGGPKLGLDQAVVLIVSAEVAVGLRYKRGETDVPVVVCRARGPHAAALAARARAASVPVFRDDRLAGRLAARVAPGARVGKEFFQAVASALHLSGALKSS